MRRPLNSVNGTYRDPNRHYSDQDALNVIPMMTEASGTRTLSKYVDAPGLKPFCRIGMNAGGEEGFTAAGAGRGLRVVDGKLFAVAGRSLWQITAAGVSVPYGTIPGVGRVSMAHNQRGNGFQLAIDNGASRYVFDTLTQALQKVTDESFPGSVKAFFCDGYIGYVPQDGFGWGHSDLSDALNYNGFDRYEAEGQPDRVVSANVDNNRQVQIIGQQTTEIYVNSPTGDGLAPFVRASNTILPYGSAARDSVQNFGSGTVLLDQNLVVRLLSTDDARISTSVIDAAFQECNRQQIANAYSFTLDSGGFSIYYITVPGKFTFGYDFKNREWHRRASTGLDWWAVADVVLWNGKWMALDSRTGEIFEVRWRDYPFDGQKELVREWVTGCVAADQQPVFIHELELLFGRGGQSYEPVDFPVQPIGPSISGEAPDGLAGEPYSFSFTLTAGDAPIARTVLRDGSYVIVGGIRKSLPAEGWVWDQATATISSTTPVVDTTVFLRPRTFDTNGLYADAESDLRIVELNNILVSGNSLTGPVVASAIAGSAPTFSGINTATGADLAGMRLGYRDGMWLGVGVGNVRYSSDPAASWSSSASPWALYGGEFVVGGEAGWLVVNSRNDSSGDIGRASQVPTDMAPYTFDLGVAEVTVLDMATRVGDMYVADMSGAASGTLIESSSLGDSWTKACDTSTSTPGSIGNSAIRHFLSIVEFEDAHYACVIKGTDTQRWQLRRSHDNRRTWPDVLIDLPTSENAPWQLEVGNNVLIALAWGSENLWTSANGFEQMVPTGIATERSTTPVTEKRGRQIAYGGGYFHIISGNTTDPAKANKVVTTADGLTVSSPIALPITAVVSIASDRSLAGE